MKSSILLLLIVVIVSAISIHAAPANLEELHESVAPVALLHGERQRRVTCDLMSVDTKLGSINHAACAAHCLSMGGGRRGGYCSNGVCICRF